VNYKHGLEDVPNSGIPLYVITDHSTTMPVPMTTNQSLIIVCAMNDKQYERGIPSQIKMEPKKNFGMND
jgi:hypothetical protein